MVFPRMASLQPDESVVLSWSRLSISTTFALTA